MLFLAGALCYIHEEAVFDKCTIMTVLDSLFRKCTSIYLWHLKLLMRTSWVWRLTEQGLQECAVFGLTFWELNSAFRCFQLHEIIWLVFKCMGYHNLIQISGDKPHLVPNTKPVGSHLHTHTHPKHERTWEKDLTLSILFIQATTPSWQSISWSLFVVFLFLFLLKCKTV